MKDAFNWFWLIAASAAMIIGLGLVARLYFWLFMLGWELL